MKPPPPSSSSKVQREYYSVANYRKYSSHKYPSIQSTANSKYNAFEDEINLELLDKISKKPPKSFLTQFDESELINSMMAADVAKADVFWESTMPRIKRKRQAAALEGDTLKRINVDKNFFNLMEAGFQRRFSREVAADVDPEQLQQKSPASMADFIAKIAAKKTSDQLELRKSKEEQLKELKRRQMMQRSGWMKLVPQNLHKYFDYLVTLRKDPGKGDLSRNFVVAAIFSFITLSNSRARMAFIYSIFGNIAIMSILLTRNMPKIDVPLGMDRRRVVNWSTNSFNTAVAITALFAIPTALVTFALCSLLTLSAVTKARIAMASSIAGAAYFTAFYEVFEEKTKNGWRWKKAIDGSLTEDVQERLRREVFEKKNTSELYDYEYDPQIEEFPPQPKYVDERDMLIFGQKWKPQGSSNSAGDIDEDEAAKHFSDWRDERRDARKAPIMDVQPEVPWVGGRKGMYVQNIPGWLNTAYQKNVLKANKWRGKPTKFVKDTTEFEPVVGPLGFRDKQPSWLDLFGTGIWEEKITASRKAARAFGSYRKTMWKIDKEVQLQPCDGADK
eukprot:gene22431-30684_t